VALAVIFQRGTLSRIEPQQRSNDNRIKACQERQQDTTLGARKGYDG
jgi:hypothetical protein